MYLKAIQKHRKVLLLVAAVVVVYLLFRNRSEGYRAPDSVTNNLNIYDNTNWTGSKPLSKTPNSNLTACRDLLKSTADAQTAEFNPSTNECNLYTSSDTSLLAAGNNKVFMKISASTPSPAPNGSGSPSPAPAPAPTPAPNGSGSPSPAPAPTTLTPSPAPAPAPTTLTPSPAPAPAPQVLPYDVNSTSMASAPLSYFNWTPNTNISTISGNVDATVTGNTGTNCATVCEADSTCQSFTYDKNTNLCTTYTSIDPSPVADSTNTFDYFTKMSYFQLHETGIIAGSVLGGLCLIAIIVLVVVMIKKRKAFGAAANTFRNF